MDSLRERPVLRLGAVVMGLCLGLWLKQGLTGASLATEQGAPRPRVLVDEPSTATPLPWMYLPLVLRNYPEGHVTLTEVMPIAGASGGEWVELQNLGPGSASLSGWELTDEDGSAYVFPSSMPRVPSGATILLLLDGRGESANDYDLSDNLIVVHSPAGLVDILEDEGDQCALYRGSARAWESLVSFVAWGDTAGPDDDLADLAGEWPADSFAGPTEAVPGAVTLGAGGSVGLYPAYDCDGPACWEVYQAGETSPGAANAGPAPVAVTPPDGLVTPDTEVAFAWFEVPDADGYRLQVDDDPAYASPAVDTQVSELAYVANLAPGTYAWRVSAYRGIWTSAWSTAHTLTVVAMPAESTWLAHEEGGPELTQLRSADLGVVPLKQHKDTQMLCLEGCLERGTRAWDIEHTQWGRHDEWYCTRASIAMVARFFGGNLSQDYISYYAFGEGDPENDLGHGLGLWPGNEPSPRGVHQNVLQWAMGDRAVTTIAPAALTMDQVRGFIDARRPLVVVAGGASLHTCVIDGYTVGSFFGAPFSFVHWIDPWTQAESWRAFGSLVLVRVHVPAADSVGRSDPDDDGDASLDARDDSDGDGMVDLDERLRFHTNVGLRDTDNDCIEDKNDVRDYCFDFAGRYSKRPGDYPGGDGLRKEVDPDHDGRAVTGRMDGDEDANRNGHSCDRWGRCDGADTSNFNPDDDESAPVWCHTRTPTATRTNTPRPTNTSLPTNTTRPSPTAETTETASVTATGTCTKTPTRTATGTRTRTLTPTPKPSRIFEDGCCQLPSGCISGYLDVMACYEAQGQWFAGYVCLNFICQPPQPPH